LFKLRANQPNFIDYFISLNTGTHYGIFEIGYLKDLSVAAKYQAKAYFTNVCRDCLTIGD
jgi:hypothetical protein